MTCINRHDLGLLALRAGTGAVLVAHGSQKLFGWFGGGGLAGTAAGMEHMGFLPGHRNAVAAGLGEAGGGAMLALGLGTPVAGAAVAGTMAGAVAVHAPAGFFAQSGGYEYPAFLGFTAAAIGVAGAGRYPRPRHRPPLRPAMDARPGLRRKRGRERRGGQQAEQGPGRQGEGRGRSGSGRRGVTGLSHQRAGGDREPVPARPLPVRANCGTDCGTWKPVSYREVRPLSRPPRPAGRRSGHSQPLASASRAASARVRA